MRRVIFLLSLILAISPISAQKNPAPPVELFFITENAPTSPIITCTLIAQSQCWGKTSGLVPPPIGDDYFLTDDYNEQTYIPISNNMESASAGFDFITSNQGHTVFAYGLYMVMSNITDKYFYLDYRDNRIGFYESFNPPTTGNNIDLWIKYNYQDDEFSFNVYAYYENYTPILNGEVLNFWDIKQKGTPLTEYFPEYWDNCLAIIEGENSHPLLVWGPYLSEGSVTGYKIYRAIESFSDPEYADFSYLASVSASQFSYLDEQYNVGSGWYGFYKITAVDQSIESDFSNIAITGINAFSKEKVTDKQLNTNLSHFLSQNYPNPFNPSTSITYSLKNPEFVTLKIFDMLGREVAELVNENKAEGKYTVAFNSGDLPSGIYIYKLDAGKFSDMKKMLLIK